MDNNNFNQGNQQQNAYQQPNNAAPQGYQQQPQQQTYQQPVYQQPQQQAYQQPVYQQPQQPTQGNGGAIASMVCGILSIVFCWCYGVVGLVLGIVALVLYNKFKNMNGGVVNGFAKTGFICGIIGSILSALMLVYVIVVLVMVGEIMSLTASEMFYYF